MTDLTHRFIETNGIRMHVVEKGTGPLVVLCHGFPHLWFSWRHQIPVIVKAGWRVVALDMRGYGRTDSPEEIEKYTLLHLGGDMVGLLDGLGAETAAIAGHDWGAPVAWHAGLLRPDRFSRRHWAQRAILAAWFVASNNRYATDRGYDILPALQSVARRGRGRL